VVTAAIALLASFAGSSPAARPSVLAIVNGRLGRYDALTLKALGRTDPVGPSTSTFAWSPTKRRLALGTNHPGIVRVLDAGTLKTVATIKLFGDEVDALDWVSPNELLAEDGGLMIDGIDLSRRRIAWEKRFPDAGASDITATSLGSVFVAAPAYDQIGPASLALIDPSGAQRSVELDRIPAGIHSLDPNSDEIEQRQPGLAVDPARHVAYVVGADRTIAAVDLTTFSVSYAGGSRSLAKSMVGSRRQAAWLGDGRFAVVGSDGTGTDPSTPSGLWLVDTTSWSWTDVDPRAAFLELGPGSLVGFDGAVGAAGAATVYDRAGRLQFHVRGRVVGVWFGSKAVYVTTLQTARLSLDVLDPSSGRVLRRLGTSFGSFVLIAG
jgi:hypothetical protein